MKKISITIFILFPLLSFSQDSDFGNWLIYFGNKKINDKINFHHEIQYRNYDAVGDMEQLLIRGGIGYNLTENNNNILLGYGFIDSRNYTTKDEKSTILEHRIYQQFITRQSFGRVKIQHRYRFEERWVEDIFKFRFRYFLAVNVALNNKTLQEKTAYLSFYNEVFLNSKKTTQFDRNRLYGGLGYKPNNLVRFEVGYMNQFFSSGGRDQLNLITFLSF